MHTCDLLDINQQDIWDPKFASHLDEIILAEFLLCIVHLSSTSCADQQCWQCDRCRVAKQWSDCVADLAQELEEKSGGVIIERAGSRICLFRGYTDADIPHKSHRPGRGWWQSSNEEHTPGTDAPARTPKAGTDWWNAYRENPDDMQGEAEQEEKDSV